MLDGIGALVERSLLRHHPATGAATDDRYSLLVSIRDYAAERLAAAGHSDATTDRHTDYYGHLIPPLPDWTPEVLQQLPDLIEADLHNYRSALAATQVASDPALEFRIAVPLSLGLGQLGMVGEARESLDQAFARECPLAPDRVYLTRIRAVLEFNTGRLHASHGWSQRAMDEAHCLGEPSILTLATIMAASGGASTRRVVPALIRQVDELLTALPHSGTHLPRWYLERLWLSGQNIVSFTDPERAEAAEERLLAQAGEDDTAGEMRSHDVLGWLLMLRGRFAAAEGHLARFEDAFTTLGGDPLDGVEGALDAALLRLATGDIARARADIDLAERRMREVDVGDQNMTLDFRRAAVDRAAGAVVAARASLQQLLATTPASIDPLLLAPSRWLLAVLHREAGERSEAARLLHEAWSTVAGWDAQVLDLVLECLLERAVQVSDDDPAEAVRLIGAVEADRGEFALLHGVTYDTAAMLTDLRARLGDAAVDKILAGTAGQPLPDWTVSPEPVDTAR